MSPALRSRSKYYIWTLLYGNRPTIYCRYVEETYRLEMGNAQVTQLSKAILTGADKGIFVLPKGGFGGRSFSSMGCDS